MFHLYNAHYCLKIMATYLFTVASRICLSSRPSRPEILDLLFVQYLLNDFYCYLVSTSCLFFIFLASVVSGILSHNAFRFYAQHALCPLPESSGIVSVLCIAHGERERERERERRISCYSRSAPLSSQVYRNYCPPYLWKCILYLK